MKRLLIIISTTTLITGAASAAYVYKRSHSVATTRDYNASLKAIDEANVTVAKLQSLKFDKYGDYKTLAEIINKQPKLDVLKYLQ